jgi:hypothetical protein
MATDKTKDGSGGQGSGAWARKVRLQAKSLVNSLETGYMDLAKILFDVYDTPIDGDREKKPIYTVWGFKSFRDYAEQELNLHYKKAERLRLIWYRLEIELEGMNPVVKERLVALGWSKVRELCRPGLLKFSNVESWVTRAESMNYQTVEALVRKELDRVEGVEIAREIQERGDPVQQSNALVGNYTDVLEEEEAPEAAGLPLQDWAATENTPSADEPLRSKNFKFYPDQLETVRLALARAQELSGSSRAGHNFSLICLDFLANNDFTKASDEQKLRYVAKLERLVGYKLVVVEPTTYEVLYGLSTLEKVSGRAS